ncbi:MAG: carbon-nitrogen hydrolase family protein [Pseudomonadota bacterium]
MPDTYPKFKAAVVQAAPVFINREATVEKACQLILEAGKGGAQLVAFPEVFIPGYPYWIWMDVPLSYGPWQRRLFKEAVEIPSESTEALCRAAKAADTYVVIGVNEKTSTSMSALWNTNIVIDRRGTILGKCRKLQPVSVEKVVWSLGDGSALRVFDTDIGKLGTLICGVNANPLARYALLAQGEQIHVANYPAFPASAGFDFTDQIRVRSRAHSHEGNVFTLVANSTLSQEMLEMLGDTESKRQWLSGRPASYSAIFGPGAEPVAELVDEEGILYADIDIEEEIDQKQVVDTIVRDTRFDVVSLNLNTDEGSGIKLFSGGQETGEKRLKPLFTSELQALLRRNIAELGQTSDLLRQLVEQGAAGKSHKP